MENSSFLARIIVCACAAAISTSLALAQTTPAVKNSPSAAPLVTDPAAKVPPVVYQSVFAGVPAGVEMTSADWKKANAEVGQFKRGHVDILKWDEANEKKAATPSDMAPAASSITPAITPAVPPSITPSAPRITPPTVHKH